MGRDRQGKPQGKALRAPRGRHGTHRPRLVKLRKVQQPSRNPPGRPRLSRRRGHPRGLGKGKEPPPRKDRKGKPKKGKGRSRTRTPGRKGRTRPRARPKAGRTRRR